MEPLEIVALAFVILIAGLGIIGVTLAFCAMCNPDEGPLDGIDKERL